MRSLLFLIIFSFFPNSILIAQVTNSNEKFVEKYEVSGIVVDTLNNIISNASVIFIYDITEKTYSTASDPLTGRFIKKIDKGKYLIEVSALGYADYYNTIYIEKDTMLPDIVLSDEPTSLDEVIIKAKLKQKILQNATGFSIDVKNDSLFKDMPLIEILSFLPAVRVLENGNVKLQGEYAKVMINGKFRKISNQKLLSMLEGLTGEDLENIELIDSPSAKYGGNEKKIININISRPKEDGLEGAISTRIENVDFSSKPSSRLNYKIGDFILEFSANPYSYDEISSEIFSTINLRDNSLAISDKIKTEKSTIRKVYGLGFDYTINDAHSLYVDYSLSRYDQSNSINFHSKQFIFNNLEKLFLTETYKLNKTYSNGFNFGYRYDIDDKGNRIDIAASYKNNNLHSNENFEISIIDFIENSEESSSSMYISNNTNRQFSYRFDYTLPIMENKKKIEFGAKFDNLRINDNDTFRDFNEENNVFETNPIFSNAFNYNESNFAAYLSFDNNLKKFKYSIGARVEQTKTTSSSIAENQTFDNSFLNFLPVIALKYVFSEDESSNINVSYRKGFLLPPYIQLNPFEVFLNSTTIKRGNPELNQGVYHSFNLGYTIKNKYYLSLSSYLYNNNFEEIKFLEGDRTIISYANIGKKQTYKLFFNTNYKIYSWWHSYLDASLIYSKIDGTAVETSIENYFFSINNTFNLPKKIRLSVISSLSNGNSTGFEEPNRFLRVFGTAIFSKRFLDNNLSINLRVIDIFGVNNKNENTYFVDDTRYTNKTILRNPKVSLYILYRFKSGKKFNKKSKKKSSIANDRF